jgi:hypothetical protein
MKTHVLNGIPYSVADSGEVYMYESDIVIGHITADKKAVLFLDNWRDQVSRYLEHYRGGLRSKTTALMERARGQHRQPN